eukprot:TRINITY_DN510_c0_g1_i7.p1 TRINITY_DN510_c0_g1~~TRINITY_DN510_c0_g1_i7.p1  ORF type:complete len:264 (+),score=14.38 TRINITY_DN510_c0_g1_i7:256-1047(+)
MFPEYNAHYKRNFNIGYQGLRLNKMTEYRHQYAISFNKELAVHNCLHDPNEARKRNGPVVKNKIIPESKSNHEYGLSEPYECLSRDYIRNKADCRAGEKYARTPNIIKLRPVIAKRYSCNILPEPNHLNDHEISTHKKYDSLLIAKDNTLKTAEDLRNTKTPVKSIVINKSEDSQKRRKIIDEERRSRALRYKKCLDLQMLIKNGKERYERLSEKKEALKTYLAEVYEKQMEERKSVLNTVKDDKDDFCSILEVNRERYFKVL